MKRLLAALALMAAFSLAGCAQHHRQLKEMETLAAGRAQDYLRETYGAEGQIQEVKAGTYQSGFHLVVDTDALVTVALGEETFQVYVETAELAFCRDNREGLALARDLEGYFRELYRLPPAREGEVRVYHGGEGFFAARPGHLAREYNFLDFDYHGQPLEEVLPLLERVAFAFDYLDDGVSLDRVELRDEDWGGDRKRVELDLRCFRAYREDSPVPLGIGEREGHLVLLAEGMEFSRRGEEYGSLDEIAEALPAFVLRERLTGRDGEVRRERYDLASMGNFWVSAREGLSPEDCFVLAGAAPDWTGENQGMGSSRGQYYTREEIREGSALAKTTRKELAPFAEAGFRQEGELLLPREGAEERLAAWSEAQGGDSDPPAWVMIRPSLVYGAGERTGAGLLWQQKGQGEKKVVQLYTSYLDQETRWTHGLWELAFSFPGTVKGVALVRVEK